MTKICKKCGMSSVKKNGYKRGRQMYKCTRCGHVFQNKKQCHQHSKLRTEYVQGKQTLKQLADKHDVSVRTIQRRLTEVKEQHNPMGEPVHSKIVLVIDTTYFGRLRGIMVFRSYHDKKNILFHETPRETIAQYREGIKKIRAMGYDILAIICDGKRGMLGGFGTIPTQMCHVHQRAIIRRYIKQKPLLEANKELKDIVSMLGKVSEKTFIDWLNDWHSRYSGFLKERGENGKYIHDRTRKAYRSLTTNLQYLFVYLDYPDLNLPKDSNSLESIFSHMKDKVRVHRGLLKENKLRLCFELLTT